MRISKSDQRCGARKQQGVSLIVVMLVLLVVTVGGIAAAKLALLGEMSARHDRDTQIAFEAAEAALLDAESDIDGIGAAACATLRSRKFEAAKSFGVGGGCTATSDERGMCLPSTDDTAKPTWATVDFLDTSSTAPTVEYGTYTCRTFDTGSGIKPARAPRYIVERVTDKTPGKKPDDFMFRITAMGFGPRVDTRAVVQVEYRKKEFQ